MRGKTDRRIISDREWHTKQQKLMRDADRWYRSGGMSLNTNNDNPELSPQEIQKRGKWFRSQDTAYLRVTSIELGRRFVVARKGDETVQYNWAAFKSRITNKKQLF